MVLTVRFEGGWLVTGSGVGHVQGLWGSLVQGLSISCFITAERLKYLSLFRSYRKQNQL